MKVVVSFLMVLGLASTELLAKTLHVLEAASITMDSRARSGWYVIGSSREEFYLRITRTTLSGSARITSTQGYTILDFENLWRDGSEDDLFRGTMVGTFYQNNGYSCSVRYRISIQFITENHATLYNHGNDGACNMNPNMTYSTSLLRVD